MQVVFLFSLGVFPEVELLDGPQSSSIFNLGGTATLFSPVAVQIYSPTSRVQGSLFSTVTSAFDISCLSDNGHSNRHEVITHCGFNVHFNLFRTSTIVTLPIEMV